MFKLAALASLISLLPLIKAQQSVYGQCGGIGWTGATTCVSGSTCTYLNDYYSQCLPSSSTTQTSTSATSTTSTTKTTSTVTTTSSGASGTSTGNPFSGCSMYISPYYASEVSAAAAQITDSATKAKALEVADIPTFIWLDSVSKIPSLDTYMADAATKSGCTIMPIVIYDLPNRDCHAKASNGEFTISNNGVANYYDYIDQIVAIINKYPSVKVVAVIEPDSLANLVTNLSDSNCANAEDAYLQCTNYALEQLSAAGVISYLDAGHAGWLGWTANLQPAADLFIQVYTDAGSPPQVRGLATNVANYNALVADTPDPITSGDPNYDEMLYINALAPLLQNGGFNAHFIVDQGRSGVQDIRVQWGDWCNIDGAGFGTRPTTNTGSDYIDSIVWVKPGGESDGTSNSSSPRYDSTCSLSDAKQPAPEAGTWFQDYFVDLVNNANPSL